MGIEIRHDADAALIGGAAYQGGYGEASQRLAQVQMQLRSQAQARQAAQRSQQMQIEAAAAHDERAADAQMKLQSAKSDEMSMEYSLKAKQHNDQIDDKMHYIDQEEENGSMEPEVAAELRAQAHGLKMPKDKPAEHWADGLKKQMPNAKWIADGVEEMPDGSHVKYFPDGKGGTGHVHMPNPEAEGKKEAVKMQLEVKKEAAKAEIEDKKATQQRYHDFQVHEAEQKRADEKAQRDLERDEDKEYTRELKDRRKDISDRTRELWKDSVDANADPGKDSEGKSLPAPKVMTREEARKQAEEEIGPEPVHPRTLRKQRQQQDVNETVAGDLTFGGNGEDQSNPHTKPYMKIAGNNDPDYQKLKKGDHYVAPNGKVKIKQ